ncbi:hypothetical protein GCM10027280_33270 [Micromonospora polyrhachis]|uniref:VCBS repeat-containing protein n=1 Tax=Micromonospora polyrhachis TaxID=1282883 RepID=A0A7W7SU15_9ACTN|nr:VCBS repeat-containing protein [Micromonospora polyrhachis]MBB4960924.1 hypothetical protein [Micromonospora polyrhachis]
MWTRRTVAAALTASAICIGVAFPAGAATREASDRNRVANQQPGEPFYGDLDGDGHNDRISLAAGDIDCLIIVEAGDPAGSHHPPVTHSYQPPALWQHSCPDVGIVVDLGGDGEAELVLGWANTPRLLGYQLFALRSFLPFTTVGSGFYNHSSRLELADLDGDGLLDIVVTGGWGLRTFRNLPDGTLAIGPHGTCTVAIHIALADFNHDGGTDIVVSTLDSCGDPDTPSRLLVMLSDGRRVTLDGNSNFPTVTTLDANRDGHLDIRATRLGTVTTYFGGGDGRFVTGPVTNDDLAHAYRNTPKVIKVRVNDWASTTATLTIVTPPQYGYLSTADPRYEVKYVRTAAHKLADTFVYQLADNGKSDTATVTVKMKD